MLEFRFLSISENEFFHEIKRDGITSLHGIHVCLTLILLCFSPGAQPFPCFDAKLLCNRLHKQEQRENGGEQKNETRLEEAQGPV